jgi:hypothetical protein
MSGQDEQIQARIVYKGEVLYEGPVSWDWDDDDETGLRGTIHFRKPEDYK